MSERPTQLELFATEELKKTYYQKTHGYEVTHGKIAMFKRWCGFMLKRFMPGKARHMYYEKLTQGFTPQNMPLFYRMMAPVKVIYIDVDGVLSCDRAWLCGDEISRSAVRLIQRLMDETGAKLVLSTVWGDTLDYEAASMVCEAFGFKQDSLFSPSFQCDGFLSWKIEKTLKLRGEQIQQHIDRLHPHLDQYLIIDDETDMLPEQHDNFVHVDSVDGFNARNYYRAKAILQGWEAFPNEAAPFIPSPPRGERERID